MRQNNTRQIALGGVLAAVAVVIMCLGGLIPVATYICPMLCCVTQFVMLRFCGKRLAWTWFIVVALLSVVIGPDKEAALVFIAIGYYPLIKWTIDKSRMHLLFKLLYFNVAILLAYTILIRFLGMQDIVTENTEFGFVGLSIIVLLGNLTFFLLDRLLTIMSRKMR